MKVASLQEALRVVAEQRLRVTEHVTHYPHGERLNAVRPDGRPLTIRVKEEA